MNSRIKNLVVLSLVALAGAADALGADDKESAQVNYIPQIHGVVRTRWELSTDDGKSRFEVRNARVTLAGAVAPTIDYFIQTDLCDQGKIKILDAWGRLGITKGLQLQAGQFRLPFGTDCFRGPANYIFANRSFIGSTVCNVRGVGAKLSWVPVRVGDKVLTLEAGAFNPTAMAEHNVWVRTLAYAGKAQLAVGNVKLAAGVQTIVPDSVRMNLLGGSVTWQSGCWLVEGEYMNKHYTNSAHKPSHAYNVYADYHFPVRLGVFNRASFQARVDGMTAHSSGTRNAEGKLETNHPTRNRITLGGTMTYTYKAVRCDIRLDYEKYFYHHEVDPTPTMGDKICAELVVRF